MSTLRIGDWEALERRRALRARLVRFGAVLALAGAVFAGSFLVGRVTSGTSGGSRAGRSQTLTVIAVPPVSGGVPSALAATPAIPAQLWEPPPPVPSAASGTAPHAPSHPAEPPQALVTQPSAPIAASSPPEPAPTPAPEASAAPAPSAPASSPAPASPPQSGGHEGKFDSSG
jgi:hypothetical protein